MKSANQDFADKPLDGCAQRAGSEGRLDRAVAALLPTHRVDPAGRPAALYSLRVAGPLHAIDADGPQATLARGQITSDATPCGSGPNSPPSWKVAPAWKRRWTYGYFTVLSSRSIRC